MKIKNKFWWFTALSIAITFIIISGTVFLFWQQITPSEKNVLSQIFKQHFIYFFGAIILIVAGVGFALDAIFHNYIIPAGKIAAETDLIDRVNPSHRLAPYGAPELVQLSQTINRWADRLEAERQDVEKAVQQARSEVEAEKNILAAFMAELPEGVMICNTEGHILLYNTQAKQLLAESNRFIGLGRSVFDVIDRHLFLNAMDEIQAKVAAKESRTTSHFVLSRGETRLRVEAVPILDHLRTFTGGILIISDITRQLDAADRMDTLWQSLTGSLRAAMASIRSASEAIIEFPQMASDKQQRLLQLIHHETLSLTRILDKRSAEYLASMRSRWPLLRTTTEKLIATFEIQLGRKTDLELDRASDDPGHPIAADTYALVQALLFMVDQIRPLMKNQQLKIRSWLLGGAVHLDLTWAGSPLKIETVKSWGQEMLTINGEGIPFRFEEIIGHHRAEVFPYSETAEAENPYLRLSMPLSTTERRTARPKVAILPEGRPEFFDFDLFNQPGQTRELDNERLSDLTYTVFDTETTGLNPQGGDRIVSLAALRVVNGRLLRQESFEQLVNPGRPVPPEATEFHGLTDADLVDQPPIEKVLPRFYAFAENTVLVAHNAAFDMRMLQISEPVTGIKFIQPVLDTLLLSAVLHPAHQNHNLRPIAKRLGIQVIDRHTAMGDAIATAEIFLKFLPLLTNRGIHTLKDAREAAQRTYYARLKY